MSDFDPEGEEPYRVTRGKPPREYMFKPGQSGNPNGRPKGSKNHRTVFNEEVDELIEVNVRGKSRKITKWRAACRQQANKAAKGDSKAFQNVAMMRDRYAPSSAVDHGEPDDVTAADLVALEELRKMMFPQAEPPYSGEPPPSTAANGPQIEPSPDHLGDNAPGSPDSYEPEAAEHASPDAAVAGELALGDDDPSQPDGQDEVPTCEWDGAGDWDRTL
jgi:hypothetical protein